jgi:hypothetical protein
MGARPLWILKIAGEQMLNGPVGWDVLTIRQAFDLTTRLTILYLALSVVALGLFVLWFVLREVLAAVRKTRIPEVGEARARVAIVELRKWSQLTALILLAYSAAEIADLLGFVSAAKTIGISALTGRLAQIFSMWTEGLWFVAALCVLSWILSARLTKCLDGEMAAHAHDASV